ncbi:MAG TPA: fructose bisphosphate aldolase [Candidatus Angelobacter sp.]|nr:fructose bisphosphate aldolase [Candidatus Angelobacter sp.]
MTDEQLERMRTGKGFIAALDQSGGSTPKALLRYGLDEHAYADDAEMFDLVHAMRSRIITSPAFSSTRVIAAILFEMTMDREIQGRGTAEFLWTEKHIVPFLKIDKGLGDDLDGARVMRPIPGLDQLLERARAHGVFGTKMRSLITLAHRQGVDAVVAQQFEVARAVLAAGLVPIVEPEIDIRSPQKGAAEGLLHQALVRELDALDADQQVMLKLTLPDEDDFYADLVSHPRVLRVAALSGGYTRTEAVALLARNHGVIASFSRALTEGLDVHQTAAEFDAVLHGSVESIYRASIT